MSCRTPAEVVASVCEIGCTKVRLDGGRLPVLGFLEGALCWYLYRRSLD